MHTVNNKEVFQFWLSGENKDTVFGLEMPERIKPNPKVIPNNKFIKNFILHLRKRQDALTNSTEN